MKPTIGSYWALTPPAGSLFTTVAIMQLVASADLNKALLDFSQSTFIPDVVREVRFPDLPTHRLFRGAWIDTGVAIAHDMNKARAIHMDRIRAVRDVELDKLDKEYMLADEKDDKQLKQIIAAKKQVLRDLTTTFDLSVASTPEALNSLWPLELPAR